MKKELKTFYNMIYWSCFKTMPFHVVFRKGKALRGFTKLGTAKSNCDPNTPDDCVVTGTFAWQPSEIVKSPRSRITKASLAKSKRELLKACDEHNARVKPKRKGVRREK